MCMAVTILPSTILAADTGEDAVNPYYAAIIAMKEEYPEGTSWDNSNVYYWNGGWGAGGAGCAGFAFLLSDAAFGDAPAVKLTDITIEDVRIGDILRINNDTHSVIVLEVYEDHVVIAEGNYGGCVHWGRTLTADQVAEATYMLTRYGTVSDDLVPDSSEDTVTETEKPDDTFEETEDETENTEDTTDIAASGTCGENVTWTLSKSGVLTFDGEGDVTYSEYLDRGPWNDCGIDITYVKIGANVSIFDSEFQSMRYITAFDVDENNPYYSNDAYGVLFNKDKTLLMQMPGAFSGSYTVPDSVTTIQSNAFSGCENLTSVSIPDSVTRMDTLVFQRCSSLTNVTIGNGMTYLPAETFYNCQNLRQVTLGDNITYIGERAFYNCVNLTEVNIPDQVEEIERYAFQNCTSLTTLELPEGLTTIAPAAFINCGLTEITIPEGVSIISNSMFANCENLTKIEFTGDAPTFVRTAFDNVTATAYYPAENSTWTSDVMKNYGGNITWVPSDTAVLEITSQPTTQKVNAGSNANFNVAATGTGLSYQWQYKTSSSGSWTNCTATGNKTASMTVSATCAKSGYYYRCKVTDVIGTVKYTNVVRLYVLGVKTQPTTQKVKAGATATFKVSATGANKTYQWQTKTSSSSKWANCTFTGSKTATMSVPATTARNGYYYRCKITDDAGNVVYTNTVRLYVLGVKVQPTTQKVKAGTTAKFTVSATGSGKTYQWQCKTRSSGSWRNCTFTGSKTATMSVSATTDRNGYYYRCKITDSAGNVIYTNAVRLYVLGIKTQPTSKTVKSGNTAKFTVSATGSGLTYQWQYKTSSGTWKNTTLTGAKTATLSVKGTSARNGMQYRCKITDSAGNVIYTNAVKLTVK